MEILKSNNKIEYDRKIEGMGIGLVLFKICANDESLCAKYHLFYENGWKPPVDIAINMDSSQIEYISFFAQDEKIVEEKIRNEIILFDNTIKIKDFDFSERKYEKSIQKEFNIVKVNNDIILLSKNTQGKILAYQLDENNYILCNQNNDIVGVLMKQILSTEFEVLKESNIL